MTKSSDELRHAWIAYWNERDAVREAGEADFQPFPDELRALRCGAKTRAGTPCKIQCLFRSGRCKLHGGLSTGPKSEAGKAKSALNAKCPLATNEPHEGLQKAEIEESETLHVLPSVPHGRRL